MNPLTIPFNARARKRGYMKKTGQTTQYSSELDDGYYEKGLPVSYTVLSTGAQAGTKNIDLAHYTASAGAITFDNTAKTIVDTGNGLAIFKTGDVIMTDDVDNPGPFTVTTGNVAGTITCTGATFVNGTPAGAVTIKKREAHSNNCVLDNVTGLMWSRTRCDKMGAASDGKMPWTGVAYDIFAYCAAANAASLSGFTDWRVPNVFELLSLFTQPTIVPDATTFPSFPASAVFSSTSLAGGGYRYAVLFSDGRVLYYTTEAMYCILVRGG